MLDDLLRFNEIRAETFLIDSTAKQTCSGTFGWASRNQNPRELVAIDIHMIDGNESMNKRQFEVGPVWGGTQIIQQIGIPNETCFSAITQSQLNECKI